MQRHSEHVARIRSIACLRRDPRTRCADQDVIGPYTMPPRIHSVLEQEILGLLREVAG